MPNKTKAASIGARVRELRRQRRWTQVRLAARLGISQGHLSQLERGNQSFSAEQMLAILKQFNVPLDCISPEKAPAGSQIQNALARHGAGHLAESEAILPSERLKSAAAAIREALVSADSARQVAAVAPVLVSHAGQINLARLRNEFAELGLAHRLDWALDCTLEAIKQESAQPLPRQWRLKYRRAVTIIEACYAPAFALAQGRPHDAGHPPTYDVLDPEITSKEALEEAIEKLAPIARKWRIATGIDVDDFARALRGSRGAD